MDIETLQMFEAQEESLRVIRCINTCQGDTCSWTCFLSCLLTGDK